ncbi:MAG: glycosyltransferase family 39 protein [Elusimicrobiota bacterium]|nr:glycosyltransferase family 39 protein [Elusimicrobiota bacterium]
MSSIFFDGDLHFYNDFLTPKIPIPIAITNNDYVSNIWTLGPAFFWAPFYLLGKFIANLQGNNISPYSGWYWTFINFGTMFYSILTFFLLLDTIKILKLRKNPVFYPLIAFLSTPMFFYSFITPCTAHGISAFAVALFLWYWYKTYQKNNLTRYILLGFFAGFMTMTRTQEILFVIPLVVGEYMLSFIKKSVSWKVLAKRILTFVIAFIFSFSPQMIVWKIIYGSFLAAPQKFNIALENFSLFELLFSSYHGILFWTPIFFIVYIGLFLGLKKHFVVYLCSILALTGQVIINSLCVAFWEGHSFGLRQMTSSLFVCCLGIATFCEAPKKRLLHIIVNAVVILFVLWTFSLCVASTLGLDLLEYVSPEEIFLAQKNFLVNISKFILNLFTHKHPELSVMIFLVFVGWIGVSIFKKFKIAIEKDKLKKNYSSAKHLYTDCKLYSYSMSLS